MTITIGEKIKLFRKEKGFSQQKLADLTGLARITIAQYETNKYQPSEQNLNKLSVALSIPLQYFRHFDETSKQQRDFMLSLPLGKRLRALRICEGYSEFELAANIVANQHNLEYDSLILCLVSELDLEYDRNTLSTEVQNYTEKITQCELDLTILDRELAYNISNALSISVGIFGYEDEKSKKLYPFKNSTFEQTQLAGSLHDIGKIDTHFQQYLSKLNDSGQQKLLEYAQDLVSIPKYTKPDSEDSKEE